MNALLNFYPGDRVALLATTTLTLVLIVVLAASVLSWAVARTGWPTYRGRVRSRGAYICVTVGSDGNAKPQ